MYLLLDGRVLVLDQATMESIPLFKAVFAFSDPDDGATFPLPDVKEFERNGLELLRTLVIFCRHPSLFAIPSKYQEMFLLVRLAFFLGVDEFLVTVARWLGVDRDAISNHNSIVA